MPEHQRTVCSQDCSTFPPAKSYRYLLDFSCIGDDLLHDLHGLPSSTLSLLGLSLRLGLHYLYLLAFSNLHRHRGSLHSKRGIRTKRGLNTGETATKYKDCKRQTAS